VYFLNEANNMRKPTAVEVSDSKDSISMNSIEVKEPETPKGIGIKKETTLLQIR
jgi:hypothetical protein